MDIRKIREDFPILSQKVNGMPLVYLDNAATTQIPSCVIERITKHYREENANVHRGIHFLSERSTEHFEKARDIVKEFIGAEYPEEIVFTSGTTAGINLAAAGLEHLIEEGDHILTTQLEHHSDLLPWQKLCRRKHAVLDVLPCPDGEPDMAAFQKLLENRPKITAFTHVSNLTGTVMPVRQMTELAQEKGSLVLIDGAQGIRHENVDVKEIGCDYYCFSGHKIIAPTGIGVLYGKKDRLGLIEPPWVGGGMVDIVTLSDYTNGPLPTRLEAGTPNYTGAIALGEALSYIMRVGKPEISGYEKTLTNKAVSMLQEIEEVCILGDPQYRTGAVSFEIRGVHPYDAASVLDKLGIAMRSGNHCAQPALAMFGTDAALRLSVAFYNTEEELTQAGEAIRKTIRMFSKWMKK